MGDMRFSPPLLVVFGCVLASQSWGGAWLREEKTGFVSFSTKLAQVDDTGDTTTEHYVFGEFGLRSRLTVGVSANVTPGADGIHSLDTTGSGYAFIRLPLGPSDRSGKLSTELGLGADYTYEETNGFIKTGLSWGRGITLADQTGWANVDGSVQLSFGTKAHAFKLDATLGVSVSKQVQIMAHSFFEMDEYGNSTIFAPALAWAPKGGKTRYVVAYEKRAGRSSDTGVKFSFWRDF